MLRLFLHTGADRAYFTILDVKSNTTREVLGVFNNPTEGSSFWKDLFLDLQQRGVQSIDLVASDGLQGIETVVHNHFKMADAQLYNTNRNEILHTFWDTTKKRRFHL